MSINKRLIKSNEGGGVPLSFNTITWTGNGTVTRNFTGVGFQPDLVWMKTTNVNESHALCNSVAGAGKKLLSNSSSAEQTIAGVVSSFNSDGFSFSTTFNDGGIYNYSNWKSVAWCWKAGGAAVTNTDGTITSQVSANVEAGFSLVGWTGNGGVATHGHGLGVAPDVIFLKARNGDTEWFVYHSSLGNNSVLRLYSTGAATSAETIWNLTSPTSTVFTTGTYANVASSSYNFIAYCFAETEGFSKFGSYTGNASVSGPTVTTGFEPAFVMIKQSDFTNGWLIYDNKRNTSNSRDKRLFANSTSQELTDSNQAIDFNSDGFQIIGTDSGHNRLDGNFLYMAFANQF
jgi:hypothetical protein